MFKSTSTKSSFLGDYIFNHLVPDNHPLRILKEIASFEELNQEFQHLYSEQGRRSYQPAMIARISVLKDLYNTSDEKVIQMIKENIPARMYAGIGLDEGVPHSSDLTYFRRRLGSENTQRIFNLTLEIARENGLQLGDIVLIDATHSQAKINQSKQNKTKDKRHNDEDATFSYKSKTKTFFGYKHHTAIENQHNLILSIQTTPGNVHDNNQFQDLMKESLEKIPTPTIVSADKAYDDLKNHLFLKEEQIFSAIILKDTRLKTKQGDFKWFYQQETQDNFFLTQYLDYRYEKGQSQRYKVEQPYAEMKRYHGLGICRYLGLEKTKIQAHFTATVYNLKHILKEVQSSFTPRKLNNAFKI
jgi:IS5 family transposase